MRDILVQTGADTHKCFLSGSDNFRKIINPEYKMNRKDMVSPEHLQDVREFLVTEWKAKLGYGIEADDLLGINQEENTIIASLDKDLRMIPGKHYSWAIGTATWSKDAEFRTVSELEGIQTFYKQMLQGDRTDNVFGIRGIGPAKASKIIDCLSEENDMFDAVRALYSDDSRFFMNALCLWIMRNQHEMFTDRLWVKEKILQDKDLENWLQLNQQKLDITTMLFGDFCVTVA